MIRAVLLALLLTPAEWCQSSITISETDYTADGRNVEAISIRPQGDGPFPGVLLIPGYDRTARDMLTGAKRLAAVGFASLAVSQPGFGKSQGPGDFVGPKTIKTLKEGFEILKHQPYVDRKRMGI